MKWKIYCMRKDCHSLEYQNCECFGVCVSCMAAFAYLCVCVASAPCIRIADCGGQRVSSKSRAERVIPPHPISIGQKVDNSNDSADNNDSQAHNEMD